MSGRLISGHSRPHTHTHTHTCRNASLVFAGQSPALAGWSEAGAGGRKWFPTRDARHQVPGTGYVASLRVLCASRGHWYLLSPKNRSELPSQSATSGNMLCCTVLRRPPSTATTLRLQLLPRLRLRLRACPTPATVPSTATSIGISINRSSRGPEYLTVQPHGIDTATSTAWIQIPQANHARHRRQDRQRGKCYAAAMCFQCYGPLSCLLLVMSSQEVPLVSSHLISSRQF